MAYISQITLPNGNTYSIKDSRINNYGTCSTLAGTTLKEVIVDNDFFSLEEGVIVVVKFTNTNTAANPTLKVNTTDAKAIYYKGSAVSSQFIQANGTYVLIYNGTQYEIIGDMDTDTSVEIVRW